MSRIGDQLIRAGRLDESGLQAALDHQQEVGGYLGQHLLESGSITRADLLEALARQWDITTRDLDREPPEPRLAATVDIAETIEWGWVACELTESGAVIVATSVRPGPDLLEEVQEQFPGMPVEFVACTQRDLDHVALRARSAQTPGFPAPRPPVRMRGAASSMVLAGFVAAGLIALVLAPLNALASILAVTGSLFLVAVLVQCRAAIGLAVRDAAVEREAAEFRRAVGGPPIQHAALLPAYSVLVPVSGSRETVERLVRHLEDIDYPSSRLDAVLLVAEDDDRTLAAVKEAAPPVWIRVLTVPAQRFREPALACDDGLALARGRYVVAYAADEVPAPDQLRRAVDLFEADLTENLERQPHRAPLAGLRTRNRVWGRPGSAATGSDVVEAALALDRAYPWRGEFTELARDLFSTHFNTHVLRRAGGWQAYLDGVGSSPDESSALRMATLVSTSRRGDVSRVRSTVHRRADQAAIAWGLAGSRARAWFLNRDFGGHRVTPRHVLLGFSAPLMSLGFPVLMIAAASYAVRWGVARDDTLPVGGTGVVALALGLGVAMIVATTLAVWRQGRGVGGHTVLLPWHWLVRGVAAWYAVLVLPYRRGTQPSRSFGPES